MRLYKPFVWSLIISLLLGGAGFCGLPFLVIVRDYGFSFDASSKDHIGFACQLYIIYVIIQSILTAINYRQVSQLHKKGRIPESISDLYRYFIAEAVLYFVVFILILSSFGWSGYATPYVVLFSVPYIICCTFSILLLRFFLRNEFKSELYEAV